jgi:hypothetical protein
MEEKIGDFLIDELRNKDEDLRKLAAKLEELAEIDCPLGVCVYDPKMQKLESEMDQLQHHIHVVKDTLETVERYSAQ